MTTNPHVLNLTVRRLRGHDARVVEGYFNADGELAVRGLTDVSDSDIGRRALASPEYQMEPRIERVYLGPHPRSGMPDPEGLIAMGESRGTAWFLTTIDGVRLLMPISRDELRRFED